MKYNIIIKVIIIVIINIIISNNTNAQGKCDSYNDISQSNYNNWISAKYNDPNYSTYYSNYTKYSNLYNSCKKEGSKYIKIANKSYDNGDYFKAIENFNLGKRYFSGDTKLSNFYIYNRNYLTIDEFISNSYFNIGGGYFEKKEFNNAIKNYNYAYRFSNSKSRILENIGAAYFNLRNYNMAFEKLDGALKITFKSKRIKELKDIKKKWKEMESNNKKLEDRKNKEKIARKNAPSNDLYSYKQYYINQLNIIKAQNSFNLNKQVIIAVIDDGININHSDLSKNIWLNKKEIPGNGIDDDNNGFIDDYNGWNFASDNYINVLPAGSHGTNVAGIIAAEINNNEGIMGIVKNVKIMNLRAFEMNGLAYKKNIINAISYAINNGANIINLSLGSNHLLKFTNSYNDIIKKAEEKGIIIVIASGNGDLLDKTEGVNTTINKLSPICNDFNVNNVIGVGATEEKGFKTTWSNYGNCVDFYAPGTNIFTLSIPSTKKSTNLGKPNNYDTVNGTSFSAPIISGIIGLGFNKYGKQSPLLIKQSLNNSIIINKNGGYHINSFKYLNELGNLIQDKQNKIKQNKINQNKANIEKKTYKVFEKIKKIYNRYSETKRKNEYKKILNILEKVQKNNNSGDKKIIIDYLIILINGEIGNISNNKKRSDYLLNNLLNNLK